MVKNLPARRRQRCGFLPWLGKSPLEEDRQPTLVLLPAESPWTEEPGGPHSIRSHRVGHD